MALTDYELAQFRLQCLQEAKTWSPKDQKRSKTLEETAEVADWIAAWAISGTEAQRAAAGGGEQNETTAAIDNPESNHSGGLGEMG